MSSLPEEHLRRSMNRRSESPTGTPARTSRELAITASITTSELEESIIKASYKNMIDVDRPSITFTRVDTPQIGHDTFGDDFTAKALRNCKKTVLNPYHVFLKIIGWRRFNPPHEITPPLHYKILNIVWPVLLTLLLLTSCVTQILLCFSRDYFPPRTPVNGTLTITCSEHIGSSYIILDILLIFAYLYGVYIFRIREPEHLTTFAETVFLGIISRKGYYSPKYLIKSLQFLMLLGVLWIVYSMCVSIVRIFAHGFFLNEVHLEFLPVGHGKVQIIVIGIVSVVSILGFIVFDVAYTAVIINYSIQCQLMVYYLQGISKRILNKEWEIDQSIKEIHSARQFLCKLNSHMSKATGIMMFIFLSSSFYAIYGLEELDIGSYNAKFLAVVYIFSIIQWLLWLFLPLIQAARVTRSGTWLLKTALEMRSRPYMYSNSSQLDLDSFLLYCANINMKAKLFSVPISPGVVVGGTFLVGFAFYLVFNISEKSFSWASWL